MGAFASLITEMNRAMGRVVAWLCLALVLLQVAIVLNRYCFGYSSLLGLDMINYEEALLYGFSAIFLLGAAYTYIEDGHVRVDIFYANLRPRSKKRVNLLGDLFLLIPLAVLILLKSNTNVDLAWSAAEGSMDGGLPYVYLWISMLPLFALSMAAQAIANFIRLTLDLADNEALYDRLLAIPIGILSAVLLFYSVGWSLDPDWNRPDPAWRFAAYEFGVWFTRITTAALLLWCLAALAGLTPRANTNGKA